MSEVRVRRPRALPDEGAVEAVVELGGRAVLVRYRVTPHGPLSADGDAFVPGAMMAAMWRGEPLRSEAPVSEGLLAGLPRIQDTYHRWMPEARVVPVEAPPRSSMAAGAGVAAFYSGGLDSGYTLLRRRSELNHLILIHGFDTGPDHAGRDEIARLARETAAEFGLQLLEVETNVRELFVGHGVFLLNFGSLLAGVAHVLAPRLAKVYVPGGYGPLRHCPNGSHPDVDPWWSSASLTFVHDGGDVTRCDKAEALAESDFLLARLRVCMSGRRPGKNCGRCDKCVRTMVELRIAGALKRCPAFEEPLELGRVRYARAASTARLFYLEALLQAEARDRDPELIDALRDCIGYRHWTGWRRPLTALRARYWALRQGGVP